MDFTNGLKSPPRYRKWAGISAVASALQRDVKIRIEGQYQFPNLYTLLVGPPGIGKGNAVKPMLRILRALGTIYLAPRGLSKRAFYDEMQASKQTDMDIATQEISISSPMTAVIEEFGVFLPPRDVEFMDALADVYDNPEIWTYKTHHAGENKIDYPSFNMLACTTPRGLRERFTDEIFDMGLPARITMVFADDRIKVPLFKERDGLPRLESDLGHDLEQIAGMKGEFKWSQNTADELIAWVDDDMKPRPSDPRLAHYNARRLAHITKLCMILSAARSDEMVVTLVDLKGARSLLLEAEDVMMGALAAIGANPLKEQMQQTWRYVQVMYARTGKPIHEYQLIRFMANEVPVQYTTMVIETLLASARIRASGESPQREFTPVEALKDDKG